MYAIKSKGDTTEIIDPFDISLAIATSKNILFWKFNQEFRFEEDRTESTGEIKKFAVGDKPYAMEWIENTIYIGTRNSYLLMNTRTGAIQDIKIAPPLKEPQIGIINEAEVILLGKGNKVCNFNAASGKTSWFCDDMNGDSFKIQVHNLNLVLLSDKELRVYNPSKNKILQDFGRITDPNGKYTAVGCKKYEVIIAYNPNPSSRKHSKTLLKILKEAPVDQQIERFLRMGEDKEAQRIFSIENKGKPNLEELKKEFELNTGWIMFFERLDFGNAVNYLLRGDIDPRELMFAFGYDNYCSVLRDCLSKPPRKRIEDYIDTYTARYDKILSMGPTIKTAKESLLSILMNYHREYTHKEKNQHVMFSASSFSLSYKFMKDEMKEIKIEDLVTLLSTVIIFVLADLEFTVELETFVNKKECYYYEDEVLGYLKQMENKEPLAIFYESEGSITDALKTWRDIKGDRAVNKTLKILGSANLNKKEVYEFAEWVLHEKPEQVIEIFLQFDKSTLNPESVIDFLRDNESETPLVLNYLKQLISKKQDTSQSLHDTLAHEYVRQIFQIKPSSKRYQDKVDKKEDEKLLERNREHFRNFLNESNNYKPEVVLRLINNTWMMEETILLLVKTDQHNKALETYLDKGMDKEAEDFCATMSSKLNLITTLFEIYMKRYSEWNEKCTIITQQNKGSQEFGKANEERQRYKMSAMHLLKRYATHPSLDTTRVLNAFPEDWDLTDARNYDLVQFLSTVFHHKLTLKANNSIGEGLSSMDHINMEYKLSMKKKAYVRTTNNSL